VAPKATERASLDKEGFSDRMSGKNPALFLCLCDPEVYENKTREEKNGL